MPVSQHEWESELLFDYRQKKTSSYLWVSSHFTGVLNIPLSPSISSILVSDHLPSLLNSILISSTNLKESVASFDHYFSTRNRRLFRDYFYEIVIYNPISIIVILRKVIEYLTFMIKPSQVYLNWSGPVL